MPPAGRPRNTSARAGRAYSVCAARRGRVVVVVDPGGGGIFVGGDAAAERGQQRRLVDLVVAEHELRAKHGEAGLGGHGPVGHGDDERLLAGVVDDLRDEGVDEVAVAVGVTVADQHRAVDAARVAGDPGLAAADGLVVVLVVEHQVVAALGALVGDGRRERALILLGHAPDRVGERAARQLRRVAERELFRRGRLPRQAGKRGLPTHAAARHTPAQGAGMSFRPGANVTG